MEGAEAWPSIEANPIASTSLEAGPKIIVKATVVTKRRNPWSSVIPTTPSIPLPSISFTNGITIVEAEAKPSGRSEKATSLEARVVVVETTTEIEANRTNLEVEAIRRVIGDDDEAKARPLEAWEKTSSPTVRRSTKVTFSTMTPSRNYDDDWTT